MKRAMAFARRNARELVRDPLTVGFSLGFPLVLLALLTIIQRNIPVSMFEIDRLAPGVAAFGLFAELPNTIEGFIPLETLEGEFEFIPERFLLKGNKESYSIGEKVRVKVESVDFEQRRTRFSLLAKEA